MRTEKLLILLTAAVVFLADMQHLGAQPPARVPLHLVQAANSDGIGHYVPGKWGMVRFKVANSNDQSAEGLFGTFFSAEPGQQFLRKIWVPPNSSRTAWLPVLTPRTPARDNRQTEMKSFLLETNESGEILLKREEDEKIYATPLALERLPVRVVTISDSQSPASIDAEIWTEALRTVQIKQYGSVQLVELPEDFLPLFPETLQATSGVVIMGNRLADDPSSLSAIREWVSDGGSLWIMLDLLDDRTARLLLGDAFQCQPVDRVSLDAVKFTRQDGAAVNLELRDFDPPVDFVRAETFNTSVIHYVNDWPASCQQKFGKGRIIYTTLGARAWVQSQKSPSGRGSESVPRYELTEPLKEVFDRFFEPAEPSVLRSVKLDSIVEQEIGYRIPQRSLVLLVLGTFCVAVVLAGFRLMQKSRLEQMLWFLPLIACVTAIPLVVAAEISRHSVPPTVANVQIIEVQPESDTVTVSGSVGMYMPQPWTAPLNSVRQGLLLPDRADSSDSVDVIRRLIRTDMDSTHWSNLQFPAGVSSAGFRFWQQSGNPVRARLKFGPDGLSGSLQADMLSDIKDGIIATSSQRAIHLSFTSNLRFQAGLEDVLAPRQYSGEVLLSDEQRRQSELLDQILNDERRPAKYPENPILCVWAASVEMPFTFPEEMRQTGASLTIVPIDIESPDPGVEFVIPSPFLSCRAIAGPGSNGASVSFDNRKREWPEQSRATDTWLRFQLPPAVLPAEPVAATLSLNISAPLRTIEVSTGAAGGMVPLDRRSNVVGACSYQIDNPDALRLDDHGGLLVRLNVGEISISPDDGVDAGFLEKRWKVNSLELEVRARTSEDRERSKHE